MQEYAQWHMNGVVPTDKFGMPSNDPDSLIFTPHSYLRTHIPTQHHYLAHAMHYASAWNMSVRDVLRMLPSEFYKWSLVSNASNWKKATNVKDDWYLSRSGVANVPPRFNF
jgi:hypothetical protein